MGRSALPLLLTAVIVCSIASFADAKDDADPSADRPKPNITTPIDESNWSRSPATRAPLHLRYEMIADQQKPATPVRRPASFPNRRASSTT